MTTGKRIQRARKEAGLSQKQLGERLGLSASMIGQWENDLRNPKKETLQRIANALNAPIYDFMDDYSPVVRELRNGTVTLQELATETNVSAEKILAVLNLEIDDPEFLLKIKRTAFKLSMREENLSRLQKKVVNHIGIDRELIFAAIDAMVRDRNPELYDDESFWRELENDPECRAFIQISDALTELNPTGQQEAIKRVRELTKIPEYQAQQPPQSPLDSTGDTDTASPTDGK